MQVVPVGFIAGASKLQVSPLRMTIKPSCSGRDDNSEVVHSSGHTISGMALIEEPARNAAIRIDPAIAQEGPVLARDLDFLCVEVGVEDLFLIVRGLREDAAEGIGDEAAAPELDAAGGGVIAGAFHQDSVVLHIAVLVADAVDRADEDAVGNRVRTLDGLPGVILALAELDLLAGMPADGRGKEERLGTLERGNACPFGIPLVPADKRADGAGGGLLRQEAKIAGREVELLVVQRIVGNVHLAIDRGDVVRRGAGVVQNGGRVVIQPRSAALEERGDDNELVLANDFTERRSRRAGDGLGDIEERVLFALAEVLRAEELRQADEFSPVLGGLAHAGHGLREVSLGGGDAGHLDEGNAGGFRGGHQ